MSSLDLSPLDKIHQQMGIKTPFAGKLESVEGIPIDKDVSNLIIRDGAFFVIDPQTGKEHSATVYIKNQDFLAKDDFEKRFSRDILTKIFGLRDSRRIHLIKCSTLKKMIRQKEYSKYHASANNTHKRRVLAKYGEADVDLHVCWNCLKELRYELRSIGNKKTNDFNFNGFFALGIGVPPETEKDEKEAADVYPIGWRKISRGYREEKNWTCECCHVELTENKELLDVHHKNKRKSDCRHENLKALCRPCHAAQPYHGHMRGRAESPTITYLRVEQDLPHFCPRCNSG